MFNEHEGARYVRDHQWKLVMTQGQKKWSLYNIKEDPTELKNLSEQFPGEVDRLSGLWNDWANKHHVLNN
ncbi:hypothetical protein [Niabella hibiscisoli]|uniref:hypothetical protein n=1 Tax=Niabella hibiscisoli TaxID=1825928 RepID=UPI001F114D24|nr:hypothetical protein [Niabella hibiscisoli]MCH5719487.1 hypothetical protein [Niabella hibiscisoli]